MAAFAVCDPHTHRLVVCARNERRLRKLIPLSQGQKRQTVRGFDESVFVVEPDGNFDRRSFIFQQWICDQFNFCARHFSAQVDRFLGLFHLDFWDDESASVIRAGWQIKAVVVSAIPGCHERIGANREFVDVSFLVENTDELP